MDRNARFRSRGSGLSTRILFCDSERDSERLLAAEADLPCNTLNLFLSGIPEGGAIFGRPSCRIEARDVGLPAIFSNDFSKLETHTDQNIIRTISPLYIWTINYFIFTICTI
jgi:hypothetical protein